MASEKATNVRNFCGLVLLKESGESNETLPQVEEKYFCVHDTRDADFKKIQNRLAYIYKFGSFNILCMEKCITSFITQNVEAKSIFTSRKLKICSLSNGPGIDVVGFLLAMFNSNLQLNGTPSLNLISACDSWHDTFKTCLRTAGHTLNSKYTFYCQIPNFIHCDIYSTFSPEVQTCITETDILLMHNVFVSSKATTNIFTNTLKKIFTLLKPGSVVFYIGSKKKTNDISETKFVKKFVNCIFGPIKVAFEDLPFNQDTAASIDIKTKQFFIVWQKKLDSVENEVLVSNSVKRKRKNKAIQSESIRNESLGNDMKDCETDESSEISFASSSVQSETSDTSNATSEINNSQYVPFTFQDTNSNNSVQENRDISLNFQSLLQSANKNVISVKENKTEHEDLLFKHAYQNGIIQSISENLQCEKLNQKEIDLPKNITEINLDEMINKPHTMSECDIKCKNVTEVKSNFSTEQCCLVTIQENSEIACNEEKQSNMKVPIFEENAEINFACNKEDMDIRNESQDCAIPMPQDDAEIKLACSKEKESDMKKENQKCTVPVLQENAETKVVQENLKSKLVWNKGNEPNVNREYKNYAIPVLQENIETKLACNKESEFMKIKNQNKSSNTNNDKSSKVKTQKNINDINERDKVFKGELQKSTIQSTNVQKVPTEINLASNNNKKYSGISTDICVSSLHSPEIESSSFIEGNLSKAIQNFIQSSVPISLGSHKMKPKIQKADSNISKTKKVFIHKAVNTNLNKLGNQIEEHTLQNKMPYFIDKERSNSQSFDAMFKKCEYLVNELEGLITSMKEDETLKNKRTLNERNCCCTLIEQKAKFANSCCMFCCRCMTCVHCPCGNICSCMSCYPKCYSETNNITTPSIIIPLKNENLLQIFRTLSLDNTN